MSETFDVARTFASCVFTEETMEKYVPSSDIVSYRRSLETGESLAAAGRVPHVAAKPRLAAFPFIVLAHLLENRPRRIELIRAEHLQNAV